MRLQEEISKLINQNQDKTRDEVEVTRKHYNRTISKLTDDIQSIEYVRSDTLQSFVVY